MGEENEIDRRKLLESQGRRYKSARPKSEHPHHIDADSVRENGIGDDPRSVEIDQNRRVTYPRSGNRVVVPRCRFGFVWGGSGFVIAEEHAPHGASGPLDLGQNGLRSHDADTKGSQESSSGRH